MTDDKKTATELAEIRTDLAARRTLMAIDRTLMAWLRTALSMISFGFTIYKVLQSFQAEGIVLPHADTPRNLGLFLIGLGTLAIIMGASGILGVNQTIATSNAHSALASLLYHGAADIGAGNSVVRRHQRQDGLIMGADPRGSIGVGIAALLFAGTFERPLPAFPEVHRV